MIKMKPSRPQTKSGCSRPGPSWVSVAIVVFGVLGLTSLTFLGPEIPRIPQCLGDTGLIVSDDELQPHKVSAFPFEGYFIRAFVDRPNYSEFDSWGLLAVRLKTIGLSELEQGNKVPLPMSTKRSRKRILVPQCPDVGKWL